MIQAKYIWSSKYHSTFRKTNDNNGLHLSQLPSARNQLIAAALANFPPIAFACDLILVDLIFTLFSFMSHWQKCRPCLNMQYPSAKYLLLKVAATTLTQSHTDRRFNVIWWHPSECGSVRKKVPCWLDQATIVWQLLSTQYNVDIWNHCYHKELYRISLACVMSLCW